MTERGFFDAFPSLARLSQQKREQVCAHFASAPGWLTEQLSIVEFPTDTIFIREGQSARDVYVVASGTVKAIEYRVLGVQYDFIQFTKVYAMGGMEVLMDLDQYRTTLRTMEPCIAIRLSRDAFSRWLSEDVRSLKYEARLMGEYLLEQGRLAREYMFLPGPERLAKLLVRKYEEQAENGILVVSSNRQIFANETGFAIKTVNRAVKSLTDGGYITRNERTILVNRDQSFNQTTYEACKAYCEPNGVDFTYFKPVSDSDADRIAMVDAAVMEGYNIIVLPGFSFPETIKQTADVYPDVKFIALDVGRAELGEDYVVPANVYCAIYQEELSGYMAGVAAVKMGYRHIGVLGGMAAPAVQRFAYGFLQGVDDAAVELNIADQVKVEYVYGGQFYGDADITAVMDTWYSSLGVEIVFSCGGGICVDVDQAAIIDPQYGEGMTVTSAMKGLGPTVENTLKDVIENDNWAAYSGKIASLGLVSAEPTENYVQLPMDSTHWCDTFTQNDYRALVAAMFDGSITVSNDTNAMPETVVEVQVYANIKG